MRFHIKLFQGGLEQDCGPTRLIEMSGIPADSLCFNWSRSYFCRNCGRIWATWAKEDTFDIFGQNWQAINHTCPDHEFGSYYHDTPGSLVTHPFDILVLNRPMLEHEFLTLMEKHYERSTYRRDPPTSDAGPSCGGTATDPS